MNVCYLREGNNYREKNDKKVVRMKKEKDFYHK